MGCIPSKEKHNELVQEPLINPDSSKKLIDHIEYPESTVIASYSNQDSIGMDYETKTTEQAIRRDIIFKLESGLIDVAALTYANQGQTAAYDYCSEYFPSVKRASILDGVLHIHTIPQVEDSIPFQELVSKDSILTNDIKQQIHQLQVHLRQLCNEY